MRNGRFKGTGPIAKDEHIPLATLSAAVTSYSLTLTGSKVSDTETWYVAVEGTYKLRLSVGDVLSWELLFADQVIERRSL